MPLSFVRTKRPDTAFTAALTFLAAREPFRSLPLGSLVETVAGAIRRGHYIFAMENGRVVGLTCWALTDSETARRWVAGETVPTYEETLEGDTVVLQMGGGAHPQVALLGIRHIAGLYPGRPYVMTRFGRKRVSSGRFPSRPSQRA